MPILLIVHIQLFSLTLCDSVIPSKASEINTTCASSFSTDERSDEDVLILDTEVIHVYLQLKHFRRLADPAEHPVSDSWVNSDI